MSVATTPLFVCFLLHPNAILYVVMARYEGSPKDFLALLDWVKEKCVPLVRELRFDNAEALTEEGLPFLVLFKHKDDEESLIDFTKIIDAELREDRERVNFLHADG
jgi:endoplasmic reticulum resident protein 44